jgi:hypothetical protein
MGMSSQKFKSSKYVLNSTWNTKAGLAKGAGEER